MGHPPMGVQQESGWFGLYERWQTRDARTQMTASPWGRVPMNALRGDGGLSLVLFVSRASNEKGGEAA
jgi:hypothetical protein